MKEYSPGVPVRCPGDHRISANREPVEHGIVECQHSRARENHQLTCGSRLWILQLEGGRRLVVPITEATARLIRERRMTAHQVLDLLGLILRVAS